MAESKVITNDFLKSKMVDAVVDRGECSDIDTCLSAGAYRCLPSTLHKPAGAHDYGLLIVTKAQNYISQEYRNVSSNPKIFLRQIWGDIATLSSPWREL